ncbi:hypothetical protein [[Limnothrix rosea] IAM M-220]|uniref:hypothetical protein n=1 Tax=[Limnothrix rosea] IAM M-220 TaxID=454133 RepID=UPI0011158B3A|nr:hypothetical protein [[Limnothrix rosea] IAM M-220]
MSSNLPHPQRIHSQREFEDSLNTLSQLSQKDFSLNNQNMNSRPISWEEAAEDVESFLSQHVATHGLDPYQSE